MAVYQLPTGTYETRAAFAYAGGSFGDKRPFAATAILVTHPQGDFLIDAGFGSDIAAHVRAQPWFARAPYQAAGTASEQLDAGGYDRGRLHGVLITHSHWDHVSGLDQLQVPIWTNAGELGWEEVFDVEGEEWTLPGRVEGEEEQERRRQEWEEGMQRGEEMDLDGDGEMDVPPLPPGGSGVKVVRRKKKTDEAEPS